MDVEIVEGVPDSPPAWSDSGKVADRFKEPALAVPAVREKYTPTGVIDDCGTVFVLRAGTTAKWPAGEYRFLLRSRVGARLLLDGKELSRTPFPAKGSDGHAPFAVPPAPAAPGLPPLRVGDTEKIVPVTLDGAEHVVRLEVYVGGKGFRPEAGEPVVAVAKAGGGFRLVAPDPTVPFTADAWRSYVAERKAAHISLYTTRRRDEKVQGYVVVGVPNVARGPGFLRAKAGYLT